MRERKIQAMHSKFGKREDKQCRTCCNLITRCGRRNHHKCLLYGNTGSEATDWRLAYTACGMYNMEPLQGYVPLFFYLDTSKPEPPIEGQMRIDVDAAKDACYNSANRKE